MRSFAEYKEPKVKVNLFIRVVFCAALCLQAIPAICQSASPTLLKIDVQPGPSFTIEAGKQENFSASGDYSDGKNRPFQTSDGIVWSSQNPSVLSIDPKTGEAAGVSAGTVWVQAADPSSGIGTRVWVTVKAPSQTLQGFYVSPSPVTVSSGGSVTLKVAGLYTSGNATMEGSLPTGAKVTWEAPTGDNAQYFSLDPQTGTLTGLKAGSGVFQVKVEGLPAAIPDTQTVTVIVNVAAERATAPDFDGMLSAGESSLSVIANAGDSIEIYEFPSSYSKAAGSQCSSQDLNVGTAVTLVLSTTPGSGGASTTTTGKVMTLPASGSGPFPITLSQPLTPGQELCFADRAASGTSYSILRVVNDPNDFGRVRTWLMTGVQVTNQLATNANNSSTAGFYLEFGLLASYYRPENRHPGLETIARFELSPIPVAAPATQPAPASAPTTTQNLNLLSSQDSVRVVTGNAAPIQVVHWGSEHNVLAMGPLVKGGFGTLLNPSLNNVNNNSSGTPGTSSPQFSSAYTFWGVGGRFEWDRLPNSSDEAPQTLSSIDVIAGEFSNLPNYVCSEKSSNISGPGCGSSSYGPYDSRTVIPRVDIEAFAKIPNYPLIFGMNANLQQYKWFTSRRIDPLSKPGNDIRFIIGIQLPLSKLTSVLGVGQ